MSKIKIHHLRQFVAIDREKSLRSAARSLGLAQPVLSRGLQELEAELGVPLVERHSRGINLTVAGQRFLVRANIALGELRRAEEEAAQWRGEATGALAIGLSHIVQDMLLPRAYVAFRREYPEIKLDIIESFFPKIRSDIDDGRMDFYIGPRVAANFGNQLQVDTLWNAARVIVARHGHPLGGVKYLKCLCDSEWVVLGSRAGGVAALESLFYENGIKPPKSVIFIESILSALSFVSSTDAVMILPKMILSSNLFGKKITEINISENIVGIDIVKVKKTSVPLTPAAECFLSQLLRSANNIMEIQ